MAQFKFKLQAVLKHRTHIEQMRQRELAEAQAQVTRLQDELRRLNQEVTDASESVRKNHMTGRLDLGFLAAHRRYLAATQRKGMAIVQRIAYAQQIADEARARLAEAAKDKKIIEKLRERGLQRWQVEQQTKEMALLDEVANRLSYENLVADSGHGE